MATRLEMTAVDVSPEMLTLLGPGDVGKHPWPRRAVVFELDESLTLSFHARPTRAQLNRSDMANRMLLIIDRAACDRLLDRALDVADGTSFLIPAELKTIALAIRNCAMPASVALPYRLAKSIELICEILRGIEGRKFVTARSTSLSLADCHRVAAAKQVIDESWHEPLTLTQIARRCGLNRSKLSRGFRELYDCSVSEALAERRLAEARLQLVSTDLPIGLIGYRSGYQNNASFSRAFCRRFGMPPSNLRAQAVAV